LTRLVDVLVPNEFEAALLTGLPVGSDDQIQEAATALRATGAANVIITLGGRGALLATAGGFQHFPAFLVKPIDTTAAGDAFVGSLGAALAEGRPWKRPCTGAAPPGRFRPPKKAPNRPCQSAARWKRCSSRMPELQGRISMVICPWCGTTHLTFQPNCDKCGGPLQPADEQTVPTDSDEILQTPPAPPRPISDRYVWRLLFNDGWWIAILVFGMLGWFSSWWGRPDVGVITAFVGSRF